MNKRIAIYSTIFVPIALAMYIIGCSITGVAETEPPSSYFTYMILTVFTAIATAIFVASIAGEK